MDLIMDQENLYKERSSTVPRNSHCLINRKFTNRKRRIPPQGIFEEATTAPHILFAKQYG